MLNVNFTIYEKSFTNLISLLILPTDGSFEVSNKISPFYCKLK